MFLIITIIIFLIGALLCFVKDRKFDNCRPGTLKKVMEVLSNSNFNGYLVNTLVAFLGITTAITFTDFNTVKQEENWTAEFLEDVVLTELDTKITLVNKAISGMDANSRVEVKTEGLTGGEISADIEQPSNPEKLFETMKVYPIAPVSSLDILLADSPYKYTISRYSYSALIDCRMNFIAHKTRIDNAADIDEMVKHLSAMAHDFNRAYEIIKIELEYQNNKIGEDDVYKKIDKLYDKLRKNEESIVVGKNTHFFSI